MAVVITEIEEDGLWYRITEDDETGLYIKEALGEPLKPDPSLLNRLEQLEDDNLIIMSAVAEAYEKSEQDNLDTMLAITEIYELLEGAI